MSTSSIAPNITPVVINVETALALMDAKDPRVVTRLIQQGKVKAMKVGHRYKVNYESLMNYLNGETSQPVQKFPATRPAK